MSDSFNDDQVIELLKNFVNAAGGQGQFAKLAGVSQQHISSVLRYGKPLSSRLLAAMGLRKAVVYLPLKRRK